MAEEVLLGGGAAVADAPTNTDPGSDVAVDDSAELETTEPTEDAASPDAEANQDTTDTDGKEPVGKTDARTLTGEDRKAVAELRKTNPKLADMVQKALFKASDYAKVFPKIQDARAAKEMIETIGGDEGLAAMQQDIESMKLVDASIESGDPAFLDDMIKDYPDGYKKLIPAAVEKLAALDKTSYDRLANGITDKFFSEKNVYSHVDALVQLITEGKQAEAAQAAETLKRFLAQHKTAAGSAAADPLNEERKKFESDKQKWEREQAEKADKEFSDKFVGMTDPKVEAETKKILASITKGVKLPDATVAAIWEGVQAKLNAKLREEPTYDGRFNTMFKQKNLDRLHKFVMSRVHIVLPDLVKAVRAQYVIGTPTTKTAAPGTKPAQKTGTPTGVINRKLNADEVDWKRTDKADYMFGTAVGKDGKTYKWK